MANRVYGPQSFGLRPSSCHHAYRRTCSTVVVSRSTHSHISYQSESVGVARGVEMSMNHFYTYKCDDTDQVKFGIVVHGHAGSTHLGFSECNLNDYCTSVLYSTSTGVPTRRQHRSYIQLATSARSTGGVWRCTNVGLVSRS